MPGLVQLITVHAAAEWERRCRRRCNAAANDIARGDIVIATMLFMEEHFLPVLPALQARREACDAMVCCMSAGEVMKLTRMGTLRHERAGERPDGAAEAPAWQARSARATSRA